MRALTQLRERLGPETELHYVVEGRSNAGPALCGFAGPPIRDEIPAWVSDRRFVWTPEGLVVEQRSRGGEFRQLLRSTCEKFPEGLHAVE